MKSITYPFLFILIIFALSSCKKDNNPGTGKPNFGSGVYVVGDATSGSVSGLALWKNGKLLSIDTNALAGNTNAIAALGSDIYVIGSVKGGNPAVWKNGGPAVLLSRGQYTTIAVTCIAFQGNDMYIGGVATNANSAIAQAVYWKNGVLNTLPGNTQPGYATVTDISVSGSDVYLSGQTTPSGGFPETAVYWKNGGQPITAGINSATCIMVSGTDVYIGGADIAGNPAYAKNGKLTTLGSTGSVYHMAINGSILYLYGQTRIGSPSNGYATSWSNSTATPLFNTTDYSYTGGACVSGSDVFVLGHSIDLTKNPPQSLNGYYWKNNVSVQLTGATIGQVNGIVVIN